MCIFDAQCKKNIAASSARLPYVCIRVVSGGYGASWDPALFSKGHSNLHCLHVDFFYRRL